MKKLELKHLAPYLPYELEFISIDKMKRDKRFPLILRSVDADISHIWLGVEEKSKPIHSQHIKPILRPLSDLTKEFKYKGKKIQALNELGFANSVDVKKSLIFVVEKLHVPYTEFIKLCEWHFDVFGLIEKGLAIDINTLDK